MVVLDRREDLVSFHEFQRYSFMDLQVLLTQNQVLANVLADLKEIHFFFFISKNMISKYGALVCNMPSVAGLVVSHMKKILTNCIIICYHQLHTLNKRYAMLCYMLINILHFI